MLRPRSARAFSTVSLLEPIQLSLQTIHTTTGLPWWSTFAVATIGFRSALIPLTLTARHYAEQMSSGPCLQHTLKASELYNKEMQPLRKAYLQKVRDREPDGVREVAFSMISMTWLRIKLQYNIWKLCKVKPLLVFTPPLVQLSAFLTYAIAVRGMIRSGDLDLSDQGVLWFTNLAQPDPLIVLPCLAVGLSYWGIEQGWRKAGPLGSIGSYLQAFLLLSFPMVAQLPSAVFMYWIPSTTFSITQLYLLRAVRKSGP